jgi:hypothetical protein
MNNTFGIKVIKSNILPYEKTYPACNIDLKMEVGIPSGEWVHILQVCDVLHVSPQVYEEMIKVNYPEL